MNIAESEGIEMKGNAIASASSNFINDMEHENGLMVMGLPTGIGKTHGNCVMMLNEVTKNPDTSFIYITEQNKNIKGPYEDLKKLACDPKGECRWSKAEFDRNVLWLKSNVDMFEEGFDDSLIPEIRNCFSEHGADAGVLNSLLDSRKAYQRAKKNNSEKEYLEQLYNSYQNNEGALRREIRKILRPFSGRDGKLHQIDAVPELNWISKVYKVIRFKDARIVLMSDKKFTETIDPLVSSPMTIWEETDLHEKNDNRYSTLRDRVIVIDEFDTFKRVLEDHLIDENLKQMDVIRAFRNCCHRLPAWKDLPDEIQKESAWWIKNKSYSIEKRFDRIIAKGEKIRTEFRMQHLFKLFGQDEDGEYTDPPSNSFMFRDYEPNTVGNAFTIKTEEGDRYNRILVGTGIS